MNNLRSGRPWLTLMDILGERHNPWLINFLCSNISDGLVKSPGLSS